MTGGRCWMIPIVWMLWMVEQVMIVMTDEHRCSCGRLRRRWWVGVEGRRGRWRWGIWRCRRLRWCQLILMCMMQMMRVGMRKCMRVCKMWVVIRVLSGCRCHVSESIRCCWGSFRVVICYRVVVIVVVIFQIVLKSWWRRLSSTCNHARRCRFLAFALILMNRRFLVSQTSMDLWRTIYK